MGYEVFLYVCFTKPFAKAGMKKVLFLFFILSWNYSQGQITFQKTYGTGSGEGIYALHKTLGGGYAFGGYRGLVSGLVKINDYGDTLWTLAWGPSTVSVCSGSYLTGFTQTRDSGFISVGNRLTCDNSTLGYVCKIDKNGHVVWEKGIAPANGSQTGGNPYDVIEDKDGNIVIAGYSSGYGFGSSDAYLAKLNPSGDTLWSRLYGGTGSEEFYDVIETSDGGYIASGGTNSFGQGGYDVLLVKVGSSGNIIWSKTYGDSLEEYAYENGIDRAFDGGYIMTGRGTTSSPKGTFWLKVDSTGARQWSKYYTAHSGHAAKQAADTGYAFCAFSRHLPGGFSLIKTDSLGNVQWNKQYGSATNDACYAMEVANDGYVVAGRTNGYGSGSADAYLVKTDLNGVSGCNEWTYDTVATDAPFIEANVTLQTMAKHFTLSIATTLYNTWTITNACSASNVVDNYKDYSFQIYPNPAHNVLNIECKMPNAELRILDVMGREVYKNEIGNSKFEISNSFPPGLYFVQVRAGEKVWTQKLVNE
jgi:hypothetical protein